MRIIEKSARQNKNCYKTENFEEIQKNRMIGQLIEKSSRYYIDNFEASFGYFEEDGEEKAIAWWSDENGEEVA